MPPPPSAAASAAMTKGSRRSCSSPIAFHGTSSRSGARGRRSRNFSGRSSGGPEGPPLRPSRDEDPPRRPNDGEGPHLRTAVEAGLQTRLRDSDFLRQVDVLDRIQQGDALFYRPPEAPA